MQKHSIKRKYLLAGAIATIVLATIWSLKSSSAAKKNDSPNKTVRTTLAKEAAAEIPLKISGFVRGENRADISPMVSGRILQIFKHEGDMVRKGEILATIEADQSDAQVAAASASTNALEKTLEDTKKYYDQLVDQAKTQRDNDNSDGADEAVKTAKRARDLQIQAMQNQIVAAKGSLNIAKAGRNNFNITSPFSGTITAIYAREGGFANFSMPMINIATKNGFEIETYVSASAAQNVLVGQTAIFQAKDQTPLTGTITTVSAGADSLSLKTLVRVHINDSSNIIRLGDFLKGEIMTPRKQAAISIPRNSIVTRGGDQFVFVVDENSTVTEQPIKIISENADLVDVSEGIDSNQKIVTEGQQYLINGETVTPYEKN